MNSTADAFFPPRAERGVREAVLAHFPFPLAVTYARLQDEMDRQEPIAAAWQLRDAFECALKFCACVAVADFLQAGPEKEQAERLVGLLFKPNGLSLGDWHTLVEMALEPLTPLARENRLGESRRSLPALYHVFFTAAARRAKRSKLNLDIDGSQDAFVAWRNRVFGHGVFQQERAWYAAETLAWLPRLDAFYDALAPVLQGWALRSEGSEHPPWQGLPQGWPTVEHEHEPLGEPAPLVLRPTSGDGKPLSLGPLVSVQTCAVCQQPAVFFFDRNRYERKKDRHKTKFLEYFRGHSAELRDWPPVSGLARNLPAEFEWQRSSYDKLEVVEGKEIVFRDFESEYLRPDYLVDAVWDLIEEGDRGYIHIVGPGGVGKTYLARGLEEVEGAQQGIPVLAHYFQGGATTGHQTFIVELGQRAYERLRFQTPQIQGKGTSRAALQAEFAAFLAELKAANRLHTLIVVLDALDELPEPEANEPSIADYLPAPADLPEGCFLVLTGRERLSPRVQANLDGLRADPERYRLLSLDPAAEPQQALLRAYLRAQLPVAFCQPAHIETVLERCRGLFLYAYHLAHALSSGAFTDTADLPAAPEFYPRYLERLRDRVGKDLYQRVYLPTLLFLCASRTPVTLDQLERWGVPGDRLRAALLELRDFVWEQRVLGWHEAAGDEPGEKRYAIAHDGFTRYVAEDSVLQEELIRTHIRILLVALSANAGRWQDIDISEAEALYDLRFAIWHEDLLSGVGVLEKDLPVSGTPDYGHACLERGTELAERDRHGIAVALLANAAQVFEHQIQELGRVEFQPDLALTRMNQGLALWSLGDGRAALAAYAEAEALYRALITGGRGEFEPDLARTRMNQGAALWSLGDGRAALAAYAEAEELYRALIAGGRGEFEPDLAHTRMNQGNALDSLGDGRAALAAYAEAEALYRALIAGGRGEFEPNLAHTRMNQGAALDSLGDGRAALAAYAEAEALYRALIAGGRGEFEPDLARTRMNQGAALRSLGDGRAALAAYAEAEALYRALIAGGRGEFEPNLAHTRMNQGIALWSLGDGRAALAAYAEAEELYRALIAGGRGEFEPDLALTRMNQGIALWSLGDGRAALAAYAEAEALYRALIAGGRGEFEPNLAHTRMNQGIALWSLGDGRAALAAYAEAEALYRALIAGGRGEFEPNLAHTRMNQGLALRSLGDGRAALAAYAEAEALYRALIAGGRGEFEPNLAHTRMNQGIALRSLGDGRAALAAYAEAEELYRALITGGRGEFEPDLARTRMNQGAALGSLGDGRAALAAYAEAEALYRALLAGGRGEFEPNLAHTRMNQGAALDSLGDGRAALAAYAEAEALYRALIGAGRGEFEPDLARTRMNQGAALDSLGDGRAALAAYAEAEALYRALIGAGRGEFEPDLARTRMNQGAALDSLGDGRAALAAYAEAEALYRALIGAGRGELEPDLARTRMNQGIALRSLGDGRAALAAYAEAEALYRALIAGGRGEFEPDLADAIMNRGRVFDQLGQSEDALACHQESVTLLRALMTQGLDVGDALAQALVAQSLSLIDLERFQEALEITEQAAITVAENAPEGTSEEPRIFEIQGCRVLAFVGLKEWSAAADAIAAVWEGLTLTVGVEELREEPPFPWGWVRADLRELSETHRAHLYDALGSARKPVQDWVESE